MGQLPVPAHIGPLHSWRRRAARRAAARLAGSNTSRLLGFADPCGVLHRGSRDQPKASEEYPLLISGIEELSFKIVCQGVAIDNRVCGVNYNRQHDTAVGVCADQIPVTIHWYKPCIRRKVVSLSR